MTSPRVSRCRSCGERIYWARTASGKPMPVDVVRAGNQTPRTVGNVDLRRRTDDPSELTATVVAEASRSPQLWTSHFATCPHAAQHRRASS